MTSMKSSRTWADIQESLGRVRQQYGLLPRAEWDDLIAMAAYEKATPAKHQNKSLPRLILPSLISHSNWDPRDPRLDYANTKQHKHPERRRSSKYDPFSRKPVLVKTEEHEQMKPTLEHNAYRYFTENKPFSRDFVDSFISDTLMDEIVPDVLLEALATKTQMPKRKFYGKKTRHWKPERSSGSLSMSLLDELLIETLKDLSTHVLRRMVRDFVDDHLVRSALHDCIDEILTGIIRTELSSMVDELNAESEEDRLLDDLIKSVIDREMEDAVLSVLAEWDEQLSEWHRNQMAVTANKHVVDLFLLEHLLGMVGTHEPPMFGKDPMQCLLDSMVLDVLLGQQIGVQQAQEHTLENYPALRFHQTTVSKVALEVILTELHMMLVEDMDDLFEYETEVEFGG